MANKVLKTRDDLRSDILAALDRYVEGLTKRSGEQWEVREIYETQPNEASRRSLRRLTYARALIVSDTGARRRLCWGEGFAGQRWFWQQSGTSKKGEVDGIRA